MCPDLAEEFAGKDPVDKSAYEGHIKGDHEVSEEAQNKNLIDKVKAHLIDRK